MKRDNAWLRQYHNFLETGEPFAWGQNDCCLYAANAIQALTGEDIAAEFRDKYQTETGAFRLIRKITNGSTVADAVAYCAGKFGMPECPPLMAQRGDLVVIENGDNLIAGVVHLNGRHVVSVSQEGPVRLSINSVKRAWHV